jgi:hypothetical protein
MASATILYEEIMVLMPPSAYCVGMRFNAIHNGIDTVHLRRVIGESSK